MVFKNSCSIEMRKDSFITSRSWVQHYHLKSCMLVVFLLFSCFMFIQLYCLTSAIHDGFQLTSGYYLSKKSIFFSFSRLAVGPMLNASVEGYYSNFWGAMNEKVGSTLNKIELFSFFC